jgi:RWP-RK domain
LAGNDGCHAAFGNINSNYAENEIDESFASAVQTHMNRQGGAGESKANGNGNSNGNGNGNGINTGISINSHGSIGSQKSSISRNIKIDDLRSYFHLPIVEVAKQLGICTTLLKRVCRTNKIKKWPYRQIRSIAKSIQSLEMASMNGLLPESERDKSQEQITFLKRSLEALIDDPSIPSES